MVGRKEQLLPPGLLAQAVERLGLRKSQFQIPRESLGPSYSQVPTPGLLSWGGESHWYRRAHSLWGESAVLTLSPHPAFAMACPSWGHVSFSGSSFISLRSKYLPMVIVTFLSYILPLDLHQDKHLSPHSCSEDTV